MSSKILAKVIVVWFLCIFYYLKSNFHYNFICLLYLYCISNYVPTFHSYSCLFMPSLARFIPILLVLKKSFFCSWWSSLFFSVSWMCTLILYSLSPFFFLWFLFYSSFINFLICTLNSWIFNIFSTLEYIQFIFKTNSAAFYKFWHYHLECKYFVISITKHFFNLWGT